MDAQTILNFAGFIIGILGILLSIYLYIRSLDKKEPVLNYATFRDIEKIIPEEGYPIEHPTIRILFGDREIDRVFTTYLWFWNKGNKPITKDDLVDENRLRLELSDGDHEVTILGYGLLKTSRDSIQFELDDLSDSSMSIKFKFLDKHDGASFLIQHTGSGNTVFKINSTILGVPTGVKLFPLRYEKPINKTEFFGSRLLYLTSNSKFDVLISAAASLIFGLFMFGLLYGISLFSKYMENRVLFPEITKYVQDHALLITIGIGVVSAIVLMWNLLYGMRMKTPGSIKISD